MINLSLPFFPPRDRIAHQSLLSECFFVRIHARLVTKNQSRSSRTIPHGWHPIRALSEPSGATLPISSPTPPSSPTSRPRSTGHNRPPSRSCWRRRGLIDVSLTPPRCGSPSALRATKREASADPTRRARIRVCLRCGLRCAEVPLTRIHVVCASDVLLSFASLPVTSGASRKCPAGYSDSTPQTHPTLHPVLQIRHAPTCPPPLSSHREPFSRCHVRPNEWMSESGHSSRSGQGRRAGTTRTRLACSMTEPFVPPTGASKCEIGPRCLLTTLCEKRSKRERP